MMKKIIFISLFFVTFIVHAQVTWDYPVKPGTEQWGAFKTGQEMVDACQIPKEILVSLSTQNLAKICLNYPLYVNIFLVNDERREIEEMIDYFNGLKELSERKDGYQELVNLYQNFPILTQIPYSTSMEYEIPYKILFLELLLCRDLFFNQMNNSELVDLGRIVLSKYEGKTSNPTVYSLSNVKRTLLLGSVIIDKLKGNNENSTEIRSFIKNYIHTKPELLTKISNIIITNL